MKKYDNFKSIGLFTSKICTSHLMAKNRKSSSSVVVLIVSQAELLVYTIHLSSPPPGCYIFSLPFRAHIVTVS